MENEVSRVLEVVGAFARVSPPATLENRRCLNPARDPRRRRSNLLLNDRSALAFACKRQNYQAGLREKPW
jgi:hypothetical protein